MTFADVRIALEAADVFHQRALDVLFEQKRREDQGPQTEVAESALMPHLRRASLNLMRALAQMRKGR